MGHTLIKKKFPDRITLELTNRCNLSCTMCPRQYMTYPQGFMEPHLFKRLIDEMVENGVRTLVPFFRGESILHHQFIELMSYAKNKKLEIQLATNGSLLTPEIVKALIDMNIDFLSFSMDTIHREQYKRIRRGGSLPKVLENIEILVNEKKHNIHNRTVLQVSAVDTGFSSEEKQQFINFWRDRVNRIRIYPQHTLYGKFGSLADMDPLKRQVCHKPFNEMVIYWDGNVASCNHDWNRSEPLGNTVKESLKTIWNNSLYQDFRTKHRTLLFSDGDACSSCDHWLSFSNRQGMIGELHYGTHAK